MKEHLENYNNNPEIKEFLASCGLDDYLDEKKSHKFSTGEKVERSKKTDNPNNKKKKKAGKK